MALQLENVSLNFTSGNSTQSTEVSFSNTVLQANVGLRGMNLYFEDEEHKVKYETILLDCSWSGGTVRVTGTLKVGQSANSYQMKGQVDVLVIAETA